MKNNIALILEQTGVRFLQNEIARFGGRLLRYTDIIHEREIKDKHLLSVFDFSQKVGGNIVDAHKYYNNYWVLVSKEK